MESVILLIAITYIISLGFGLLLEKYLKIPWMFSALFLGIAFSVFGFFSSALKSEPFLLLAKLGMLFLLFIIGFNLHFKKLKKLKKDIFNGTAFIITFEALAVGSLLYFVFPEHVHNSFLVAFLIAFSFATVGEAILLPILAEFKLLKTTFGQLTLGIGTADDVFEILTLAAIPFVIGYLHIKINGTLPSPTLIIVGLVGILLLTILLIKILAPRVKNILKASKYYFVIPLLILLLFFSFVALGSIVTESLAAIAAILSGIVARSWIPRQKLPINEKFTNFLGYIFLSPLFFLSIGAEFSLLAISGVILLLLAIWVIAKGSKVFASYMLFRKKLGTKYSLLMGVGLSVRFSTSLIVQYIFLASGLITLTLYSVLIATAILMKPVILGVYSWYLAKEKPP